jgi:hypothetical protein
MTDLQPLYDLLGVAYRAGEMAGLHPESAPTAGNVLFPLAARMEAEIQKLVDEEREDCAVIAITTPGPWHLLPSNIARTIRARSLPSSPERET